MTTEDYLYLKDLLDDALQELRIELRNNGVDLRTAEARQKISEVKRKIIIEQGFTLEEYEEVGKELRKGDKGDKGDSIKGDKGENIKGNKGDKGDKGDSVRGEKGDFIKGESGKDGKDADEDKIITEVLKRIPRPKDGKDGKNIKIKEVIRDIKKDKEIDKVLKGFEDFKEEISFMHNINSLQDINKAMVGLLT